MIRKQTNQLSRDLLSNMFIIFQLIILYYIIRFYKYNLFRCNTLIHASAVITDAFGDKSEVPPLKCYKVS